LGLACLALALLGNAWAIPRLGAEGAALVLCLCETAVCLALLGRLLVRRDIRLTAHWLLYGLPALGLLLALVAMQGRPAGQLLLVLAWVPFSAWGLSKLPAQQACRLSMARASAPWSPPSPSHPFNPQAPSP
jgi:O-antigen/teichoic acid export membrane protein